MSLPPLLALLLLGCPKSEVETYHNSLFLLGASFSAKEVCSCVFVAGLDEDFCRTWTRVSPDLARFKVDVATQQVRANTLGLGRAIAEYQGEQLGCVLIER